MYKVMLVDDEPVILEGLKHLLKWDEHGLEISAEALNGFQALKILEHTKIDILITDIKMPEIDGLELIRSINRRGLNIKTIILSGFDDFKYVKESITLGIENYILKPVNEDELSSTLNNIVEKIELEFNQKIKTKIDNDILKENIYHRWISNQITPKELEERALLLNINLNYNAYLVCMARILRPQELSMDMDLSLLKFAIKNICNEIINNYGQVFIFTDLSGDLILHFSGDYKEISRARICELLSACINTIRIHLKTEISFSIGSIERDWDSVFVSYSNAKTMMEYSLIFPQGTLFDFEKIKKNNEEQQIAFEVDLDSLKKHILAMDIKKTTDFIEDIYTRLTETNKYTPAFIQNISTELLFNMCSVAKYSKLDTETLDYSSNLFSTIFQIDNIADIFNWLKEIAKNIIWDIEKVHKNINPLIRRILDYIDTNYYRDISLKTLSSQFNVNSAYLGQLFKNEVGEMFSLYLNKVRIEKAKDLLNKSRFTAKEISLKVGYSNENYFYNIFKKMTGKYPTEYKRDLL